MEMLENMKSDFVIKSKEMGFYKIDINTSSCLYQNFYIIGLDDDVVLTEQFYENDKMDSYSPKIISKFPSTSHNLSVIPDEVIVQHCFPNGYKFENIQVPPQKFFFSFDDYFLRDQIKSDFSTIHFTCILFYENIEAYKELYHKYLIF